MSLKVTALLVTVKDSNGAVKYLYRGDVVPDGTAKESIAHLRDLGYLADDAPAVKSGSEAPAGNASRDEWAEFAKASGATVEELADVNDGGLPRDDLRSKYGN